MQDTLQVGEPVELAPAVRRLLAPNGSFMTAYNNLIRRVGINSGVVSSILPGRPLDEPGGLAFDGNTLYIANTNAHEVLRVNPDSGLAEALNVIEEYSEI